MNFRQLQLANITNTRSQNHMNLVVGEHGVQTFEVLTIVLLVL